MPDWLHLISNAMPASYALEALQQVGAHTELTAVAVRDIAVVVGCAVLALCLAAATGHVFNGGRGAVKATPLRGRPTAEP
jgi:hypothetical protein